MIPLLKLKQDAAKINWVILRND